MGSIEVFDYNQMKWVPHIPKYIQASHKVDKPDLTENEHLRTKLKEAESKIQWLKERPPVVKQVTDVAEAIERAQSEVNRERKNGKVKPKPKQQRKKKNIIPLPKRLRKLHY